MLRATHTTPELFLTARVRTLARRGPPCESELLKVGDLEIDVNRRRVRRGTTRIDLTPRESRCCNCSRAVRVKC